LVAVAAEPGLWRSIDVADRFEQGRESVGERV
jgi:hypothetical protein